MSKELTNLLQEELQAWKTEAVFNLSREALYWAHSLGEIIRRHYPGELTEEVIQNLTHETAKSRATIFRWVELYDKEPDFDTLIAPYGKNVSITKILGDGKPVKEEKPKECLKCPLHCRGMKML